MSQKTPLGRARGLGSAHSGAKHFWRQRLTAIALVPLVIWFVTSLVARSTGTYEEARAFFSQPLAAALMLMLIGAGFVHLKLGVQVIIEDYIHGESTKLALLILNTLYCAAVGLLAALAVLQLFFAG